MEALVSAGFAGRLAGAGASALEVATAVRAAPPAPSKPRGIDRLLDALATLFSDGYEAAVPILRQAQSAFATDIPATEELRWGWVATVVSVHLWDDERWDILSERHVRRAREAGALADLQLALSQRISLHLFAGELSTAASLVEELQATTEAIGSTLAPYGRVGLLALRGSEAEAVSLIEGSRAEVTRRGEGIGISAFEWAKAVLYNGLGRYEEARVVRVAHCRTSAGSRSGELAPGRVHRGRRPSWNTRAGHRSSPSSRGNDHGERHGLGPRDRGPLRCTPSRRTSVLKSSTSRRSSDSAERRIAIDLARAHLLYGEWLRRQRRRITRATS